MIVPPKSQNEKKNPFFHLEISEWCVLNVPTKSAVGWNCIEPEATFLTMQGFMSPPCRFSCPIAVVAIAWNNCTNTQRLGAAEKSRRPVRDFCEKHLRKKMPSLPQKYGFENAKKNLRPYSQIFGPGPFAGSLAQNLTPGDVFFSLTAVFVKLAMLSECVPSLSTKCAQ